jgi:IS5 family transposase
LVCARCRAIRTLAEALEQAAILCDAKPEVAIVDRGYKGVAIDGVKIYHPGLRRGITRGLRAMIRRRSASSQPSAT